MFFTDGLSKLGSSPTRLAEVLGCGIPVIVSEGVGDIDEIINKYKVGIIIKGSSKENFDQAYIELTELLKDPNLSKRCRETAEKLFSIEVGINLYRKIYESILNKNNKYVWNSRNY